jgi:putative ABC transport system permease protein
VSLPAEGYAATETAAAFYDRVLARLAGSPGVVAAGAASRVPVEGGYLNPTRTLSIDGRPALNGETRAVQDLTVTSGYLETLRVPLRQGRLPTPADGAGAQLVVVVSETTATRMWGARSPIGARVRLGDEPSPTAWRTVIGVVGDIRNDNIDAPPPPYVYVPAAQRPVRDMTFMLRTIDDPTAHVAAARAAVAAEDANLAVYDIQSMDQLLVEDLRGPAVLSSMTGIFAALALVLAAVGIYGMVAYAVAQRTREIAIRIAVGAQRIDVTRNVLGQGLVWVAGGLVLGLVGALASSQLLSVILYGVAASDPSTYLAVFGTLAGLAALACVVPLRRALRLDPIAALRQE